ncbi:TonB-dependent siderophore receptor [Aquabacterium sp. CECT 9606]|uniref:TonB-dependent receptor plug domain-containing protein n=1 Tax=Aquabacterium sp. CECT 9606 TaxID=2845822 RepID=UPI001E33B174|nr:TonB-dependent receptor [Aquabacterium sp. CECT 9606]CAH0348339.1 Vitamin B12 transporter BtuB [Aquabacterium sp. CECT 9606]
MTLHRHFADLRFSPSAVVLAVRCVATACAVIGLSGQALAQAVSEEDELALAYGDKSFVSIATGSRVPVSRAPAVATVITAQDIASMGATDLDEVLETVPGLHVARETQGFAPVYVIRGINLGFNPQVLMLINGIPMTTVYTGNRGGGWGGMPVENIARVEVIRGPGSALYGADAFAGVINVITKTSADINGTELGLRGGSFKTGDAWMLHGGKWGAVDVSGYLRVGRTDGDRRIVQADAQTGLDALSGTQASRAPGAINNGRDSVDGALDLSLDKWRFRVSYKERDDIGTGTGVASALDPEGQIYSQTITSDLTYENRNIAEDWAANMQISAMHYTELTDLTLYPAGTTFAGTDVFVDGVIGNPAKWERHGRVGGSATYTGFKMHRIRLGLGAEREEVYKTRETKNFHANFSIIGTGSRADVIDVSATEPFMRPQGRTKRYLYAQDEWNLGKDWTLTAGVRNDHYSDFGSTTNPRLALVWDAAYNVTTKLLYGTAFRAPSMSELYAINNPVVTGNPNLRPEKIRTVEAAVSWQPLTKLQLGMNFFHYEMKDIIRLISSVYQNNGQQTGNGLEFEATWDAMKDLRLTGNYSYQRSVDEDTGQPAANAPRHHVYLRTNWRFTPGWSVDPQVNWVSDRPRESGDSRADLKGYATVDLTLRTDRSGRGWDVAMSVRNLFDVDAREPTPYDRGQPFISLPYDFPLPGRSIYLQASYQF